MGTCLIQKLVLLFLLFTFCIFFTGWLNFSRFLDVSFTIPLLSLYLIARGKTGDTRYGVPVKRCITGGGLVSVPFAFGIEDKTPHISLGHRGMAIGDSDRQQATPLPYRSSGRLI